jgi:hypothetical protein
MSTDGLRVRELLDERREKSRRAARFELTLHFRRGENTRRRVANMTAFSFLGLNGEATLALNYKGQPPPPPHPAFAAPLHSCRRVFLPLKLPCDAAGNGRWIGLVVCRVKSTEKLLALVMDPCSPCDHAQSPLSPTQEESITAFLRACHVRDAAPEAQLNVDFVSVKVHRYAESAFVKASLDFVLSYLDVFAGTGALMDENAEPETLKKYNYTLQPLSAAVAVLKIVDQPVKLKTKRSSPDTYAGIIRTHGLVRLMLMTFAFCFAYRDLQRVNGIGVAGWLTDIEMRI